MNEETEILILVGGKGVRLQSVVSDVPKPMAPLHGKPFLFFLVEQLRRQNFKNLCFLTGHLAKTVSDFFGDGSQFGVQIRYSHEETPLGTGGALRQAIQSSPYDQFLILNGDSYFDIDFHSLTLTEPQILTIALCHMEDASRYGGVEVDSFGKVLAFREKSGENQPGLINAGIYRTHAQLLDWIPEGRVSFETEVMPKLVAKNLVGTKSFSRTFIDIGIPSDYFRAQNLIPSLPQ